MHLHQMFSPSPLLLLLVCFCSCPQTNEVWIKRAEGGEKKATLADAFVCGATQFHIQINISKPFIVKEFEANVLLAEQQS